jgi:inorganic pyrophosphatase
MNSAWERLPAIDEGGNVLAVIEAAAQSRCKFKFEARRGVFQLHNVLPIGTSFPHSFGFIPATLGEDGDPLDIVVLTDEPPPVATVIPCRLIAILEAEQAEDGKKIRNDRLLAVAVSSERYASCRNRKDIEEPVLRRIADFFDFYHREQGKTSFKAKHWKGAKAAQRVLDAGRKAARHPHSKK